MKLNDFNLVTSNLFYASAGFYTGSVYTGASSGVFQPTSLTLNISTTLWPTLSASEQEKVMRHEFGHMLGFVSILFKDSPSAAQLKAAIGDYSYTNTVGASYFYGDPWGEVLNEYKRITGFTGATKIPHDATGHWSVVQYQNQYPGYYNALMSSGRSGRNETRTTSSQLLNFSKPSATK